MSWQRCAGCAVLWRGDALRCWSCGGWTGVPAAAPLLTSQDAPGYTSAEQQTPYLARLVADAAARRAWLAARQRS